MKQPQINVGLEGRYLLIARKADGSKRVVADWFENLILDGGLNRLGIGDCWDRCQVGTGNTAPANGQTALVTLLTTTTNVLTTTGGVNSPTNTYAWARRTYRFAEGAAAGNLSEVGVGWSAGLFSRSLIKDEFGNPTTITVLADEALDVIYEIRAYPTMTDQVFNLTIAAVNYTFTLRPAFFSGNESSTTQWPWQLIALMTNGATPINANMLGWAAYGAGASLAPITGDITGTQVVSPSDTVNVVNSFRSPYVTNSFQRQCRVRYGLAGGSVPFGGFRIMTTLGTYQMTVSPAIPKDGTRIFSLDYTLSWARRVI